MATKFLLQKIINRRDLTEQEAFGIAESMLDGSFTSIQTSAFLTAFATKGESVGEIIGFVKAMRKHMVSVSGRTEALDVCGTGGDGKGTFNISTAVAFVAAGAGVKVVKHGNKAASSNCGSADVLEALGVNINLNKKLAVEILQKVGMVFIFAPVFHPAFKNVAPVRKELGIKTIFNFIGPFANPAGVKRQLIGVPDVQLAQKLAEVARQLDYQHLLIVAGEDGLDEISIFSKTIGFEVKMGKVKKIVIEPTKDLRKVQNTQKTQQVRSSDNQTIRQSDISGAQSFPSFQERDSALDALKGGSALENAQIIKNILSGEKGPKRDIVILNCAYALYIAGKVRTPKEGIILAERSIDSGSAKRILESLIREGANLYHLEGDTEL